MTTLGIDLGTGSVKAAIVDADGRVSARASHPYRVRATQPGWAESEPREWLAAAREVADSTLTGTVGSVDAVGFSGQMHGVVVTDERLHPLRPAILWADTRAEAEAAALEVTVGTAGLRRLGSPAVPGFAATTLAWLLEHEPHVMAKARHVLQPKDWLRAAMGGEVATDPSDASGTLMYDIAAGAWSADVLAWLGIDTALLPPVRASEASAGEVRLHGRDLPAVVGAADTACALAGLGIGDGEGLVAVGTGAQVVRVIGHPDADSTLRTHTFAVAGPAGAGWYRLGAVQSAGLALTAALEWLGATPAQAAHALEAGVQRDDPLFVPYLSGERTPFMRASLRGSWVGLALSTDRAALLRSVLEGVAQAVALAAEAVQATGDALPAVVPLVGGGTHEPAFRQLLADATGLSLAVAEAADAAVAGAGLLASGQVRSPQPATLLDPVAPRPSVSALLRERRAAMMAAVEAQE